MGLIRPWLNRQGKIKPRPLKGMDAEFIKKFCDEARKSLLLLCKVIRPNDVPFAYLCVKWSDCFKSFVDNDEMGFISNVGMLICHPIILITSSLADRLLLAGGRDMRKMVMVESAYERCKREPFKVKGELLTVMFLIIDELKKEGVEVNLD